MNRTSNRSSFIRNLTQFLFLKLCNQKRLRVIALPLTTGLHTVFSETPCLAV